STLTAIDTTDHQLQSMWEISRDPYGATDQATQVGSAINLETGFAGASSPNSGAGFVYLRNRWYDPTTGRFLTQDPIGLAGGVNLYAYAGNNPISFDDPFGLWDGPGHRLLLNVALGGIATAAQMSTFKSRSWRQDVFHPKNNKMHYLADKGESPAVAAAHAEMYIASEIHRARVANAKGDASGAAEHLGNALHDIADGLSPVHVGPNGPTEYPPSGANNHSKCDLPVVCGGKERSTDIDVNVINRAIARMRDAYDQVYGYTPHAPVN